MKLKSILLNFVLVPAIGSCFFQSQLFAQSTQTEKAVSFASLKIEIGTVKQPIVTTAADTKKNFVKTSADEIPELEKLILSLINQKRAENSLPPLAWSDEVAKLARLHSENMVKFNFFSHKDADGKTVDGRADSLGITNWRAMGENIAYNRDYENPCEIAVERWMASPTHRANILNDRWQETAIGIAVKDDGTFYFTQVFLKRG